MVLGIIIRDHNGFLVWRVMYHVRDLSHSQVQPWVIHMGINEAFSRGYNNMLIETEHGESFRILHR